jgi:hypothetical protein
LQPSRLQFISKAGNTRSTALPIDPKTFGVPTNRRNQNAPPVQRINPTTAFAPLNNGNTVVIMSRKKAAASVAKC